MKEKSIQSIIPVVFVVFGLYLAWNSVMQIAGAFSNDSFSYYDIAQTIGNDFGRVSSIRQYTLRSDYNCSFPYLYPLLVRLTDMLTGFGLYSGVALNFMIMPLTAVLILYISRKYTQSMICGAVAALFLFLNTYYLEEVCAARSIPLSVLLTLSAVSLTLHFCLHPDRRKWLLVLTGLLAGLNMMNRFDEISLAAFLVPVIFLAVPKGTRIRSVLLYAAGLIPACVPWMIYSMKHFGKLYISDNGHTMLMTKAEVPSYVYLPDAAYSSLQTAFGEWAGSHLKSLLDTLIGAVNISAPVLLLILLLFLSGFLACRKKYGEHMKLSEFRDELPEKAVMRVQGVILLYCLLKLMMYALVGYIEKRYYVEPMFLIAFAALIGVFKWLKPMPVYSPKTAFLIIVLGGLIFLLPNLSAVRPEAWSMVPPNAEREWFAELDGALRQQAEPQDSLLMVGKDLNGFLFGCKTRRHTFVSPENISEETVFYVQDQIAEADWIALSVKEDSAVRDALASQYAETEYTNFYLYCTAGSNQTLQE